MNRTPYRRFSGYIKSRLDFKKICKDREIHRINEFNRKVPSRIDAIVEKYESFKVLTGEIQGLEHQRKVLASAMDPSVTSEANEIKAKLFILKGQRRVIEDELYSSAISLPNMTDPHSPIGSAENNQEIDTFGPEILTRKVIDHVMLGRYLDILDFEAGAKVAGSQHYFLKNQGALLELALIQYAIAKCLEKGFKLFLPPDMAYSSLVRACGFSPRTANGALPIYSVRPEEEDPEIVEARKALVGTSEIPLAGYYSESIIDSLPIKMVAFGHCFRPEVGHHTADSRGLYRVHQFSKVEMFAITPDNLEQSQSQFEEIIQIQTEILGGLNLPCRVLNMATEELGASAYRKYDIESWFPFRKGWGELTSASNCTDFQSRRLALRYRETANQPLKFPHTLNGTACAIPRVIQAILENHQDSEGSVRIPEALHPYMLDRSTIIRKI